MSLAEEKIVLDAIHNYELTKISESTRFWMVRTKKGYFYKEFISKGFVALAWNLITEADDFSGQSDDSLKELIKSNYEEIKRPKTVINKCKSFIEDINEGDILVIPSSESKYVTIARAGEYYEDELKTPELEKDVINRIENRELSVNEIPCPYKKRRKMEVLTTVNNTEIHSRLFRAIANHHGISNLDDYATYILNLLYTSYSLNNDVYLVFNIRRNDGISPISLSGILFGVSRYLGSIGISEENMSTKVEVSSPGQVLIYIKDAYEFLKDNSVFLAILLLLAGGGSIGTFSIPGIPGIIKNLLMIDKELYKAELDIIKEQKEILKLDADNRKTEAEIEAITLENAKMKMEINEKIRASGINPETLDQDISTIADSASKLEIKPIETLNVNSTVLAEDMQDSESKDEPE